MASTVPGRGPDAAASSAIADGGDAMRRANNERESFFINHSSSEMPGRFPFLLSVVRNVNGVPITSA
jgi:hypothetical protein